MSPLILNVRTLVIIGVVAVVLLMLPTIPRGYMLLLIPFLVIGAGVYLMIKGKGGFLVILLGILLLIFAEKLPLLSEIKFEDIAKLAPPAPTVVVGATRWEELVDGETYVITEDEWLIFTKPDGGCVGIDPPDAVEVHNKTYEFWVRSRKGAREITAYAMEIGESLRGTTCS